MTIYYVNPATGSNSNNGLSWANAWKWLPGNGATINPGDEVRFAKSTKTQTTGAAQLYTTECQLTQLGYSNNYVAPSWVNGASNGTPAGQQISWAASTNVPASTKLMYTARAGTFTSGGSITIRLGIRGVPAGTVGQYLRMALCSDAAGNTPVAWLDGFTVENDHASRMAYVMFEYNAASTLNLTIESIALYSVGGWTTSANGALIAVSPYIVIGPLNTSPNYLPHGCVYDIASNQRSPLPAQPVPRLDTQAFPALHGGTSSALAQHNQVSEYRYTAYNIGFTYTSHLLDHYAPLPVAIYALRQAASLTFSGTSASHIKLSGGWNTGTNVRDGYTNLSIAGLMRCPLKAAFSFSSGGQYIDYEGFLCHQTALFGYTYEVPTIETMWLTDCAVGYSYIYDTGYINAGTISVPNTQTTIAVSDIRLTRTTLKDYLHITKGNVGDAQTSGGWIGGAQLTIGNIALTDSFMWYIGQYTAGATVTGKITARSSVPGSKRNHMHFLSGTFSYTSAFQGFDIQDTYLMSAGSTLHAMPAAVNSAMLRLCDVSESLIGKSGPNVTGADVMIEFRNFKDVEIDGYCIANSNEDATLSTWMRVGWTIEWTALNTPTLKVGGPCGSPRQSGQVKSEMLEIYGWPLEVMDVSVGRARPFSLHPDMRAFPRFSVIGRPGMTRVRSVEASALLGGFVSSQLASSYYPNHPEIRFENCVGSVSANTSAATGTVRGMGGSAPLDEAHSLVCYAYGTSNFSPAVGLYGTECASLADAVPGQVTTLTSGVKTGWFRRSYGVDIKASQPLALSQSNPANYTVHSFIDGHLHPSADVSEIALDAYQADPEAVGDYPAHYAHSRLSMLRRPDGRFLMHHGHNVAASSAALNEYGKHDIRVFGAFPLASLDVQPGTTLNFVLRVRPATLRADRGCRVLIPPCPAFRSTLHSHVIQRTYLSTTEDEIISFSVSPQAEGDLRINFWTGCVATIKDFTVSVS